MSSTIIHMKKREKQNKTKAVTTSVVNNIASDGPHEPPISTTCAPNGKKINKEKQMRTRGPRNVPLLKRILFLSKKSTKLGYTPLPIDTTDPTSPNTRRCGYHHCCKPRTPSNKSNKLLVHIKDAIRR